MKSKFKAVLRWIEIDQLYDCWAPQYRWISTMKADKENTPVYVIPATPEAFDAQVEAMAKGMFEVCYGQANPTWDNDEDKFRSRWRDFAKVALAALGITRPSRSATNKTHAAKL